MEIRKICTEKILKDGKSLKTDNLFSVKNFPRLLKRKNSIKTKFVALFKVSYWNSLPPSEVSLFVYMKHRKREQEQDFFLLLFSEYK